MTTLTLSSSSSLFIFFHPPPFSLPVCLIASTDQPPPSICSLTAVRPQPSPPNPSDHTHHPPAPKIGCRRRKSKEKKKQTIPSAGCANLNSKLSFDHTTSTTPQPETLLEEVRHSEHGTAPPPPLAPVLLCCSGEQSVGGRPKQRPALPSFSWGERERGKRETTQDCSRWGRLGIGCRHSVGVSTNKATF